MMSFRRGSDVLANRWTPAAVILFSSKSRMSSLQDTAAGASRAPAVERVVEQGANAFTLDWSGVWIGGGDSEIRSTLDPIRRHADVFERDRRVQATCKIEHAFGGAGRSQQPPHPPAGLGA